MTKKTHTVLGIISVSLGVICGIAGTSFTMGAEQQRIKDTLTVYKTEITSLKIDQDKYEKRVEKEMDRYAEIIVAQVTQLQGGVIALTATVGELRTDVQVIKAIIKRVEEDINRNRD